MKVLMVAVFNERSTNVSQAEAFERLGLKVIRFNYREFAKKGFLLTTPYLNMENDFIIGRDLDIFESIEELKIKIAFYLKNESKRNEIAENGFKTVQKFSRDNWAEEIVNKILAFKAK